MLYNPGSTIIFFQKRKHNNIADKNYLLRIIQICSLPSPSWDRMLTQNGVLNLEVSTSRRGMKGEICEGCSLLRSMTTMQSGPGNA